jgi:hypothetical protein
MELIIFRDIQAESIGLIRQKIEKHGEEYHYIQVTSKIEGKIFPTLASAMEHYLQDGIDCKKALYNMGLTFTEL